MINLYPQQLALNNACRASMMRGNKWVLIQSATGSGKSIMATAQILAAHRKGKRTIFSVPRKSLIDQMSEIYDNFGIPHSFIASGRSFNPYARHYIASEMTLANRFQEFKPDVYFKDEAHIGGTTSDKIIQYYKSIGAYGVLLSATPKRLDGKGLGMWADDMVCGESIRWHIDNGYLSDYKYYAPSMPDLSGIGTSGGDYAKGQLASRMEEDNVLIGDSVKHYREHAMGRLGVVFCASIKHSQKVVAQFRAHGIPAAHMDGETPMDERGRLIRAYARREILILSNVEIMTTGFDLASASGVDVTVECISDLRPTKSLALHLQKMGRALRRKDFPALIFDHAGNYTRHGMPCQEREWTLEDSKARGGGNSDPVPPSRQCDRCFFVHPPRPTCPECGYEYEVKSREIEERDGELKEIDKDAAANAVRKEQGRAQTLDDLIALGRKRGYKRPEAWAAHILSARMRRKHVQTR